MLSTSFFYQYINKNISDSLVIIIKSIIMKFKTIMVIKAIVCLLIFPVFLFIPEQFANLTGVPFGIGAAYLARLYGATLVGNMLLCWFGRNAEKGPVRQAIVLDLFFYDLIGFIAVLIFYFNGTLNLLGLGVGFIYLFLTVGFGIFLFPKK